MGASLVLASTDYRDDYVRALREGFRRGDQAAMKPGAIDKIEADFESFVGGVDQTDR